MNNLLSSIIGLSGNEGDLKQLRTFLSKSEDVMLKNANSIDDALSQLDPTKHTLGWLYLLNVKLAASGKVDANRFLGQVSRFLLSCSSQQVKLGPVPYFARICREFARVAIETHQPLRAVRPLKVAVTKFRLNSDYLTPIHADLMQTCLLAKCYSTALSILEEEVTEVEGTGLTYRDFLLYFYYGGMVYVGLKQFKKAAEFFKTAISAPAAMISAIMLEAYKKYILVSLLAFGQIAALPKYTSSAIQRHLKTVCPQYLEFATAYATHSTDDAHKVATVHAEIFQKDKNFGLVKQCIQALYKRNIQRHTQTYLTLSLQDISESVKMPSAQVAERAVLRMIEDGQIFASINQRDGMVSFHEDPEEYDTTQTTSSMDSSISKAIQLAEKVRRVDEQISSSPHYIQKTSAHERGGPGGGRWGGDFDDDSDKPPQFQNVH